MEKLPKKRRISLTQREDFLYKLVKVGMANPTNLYLKNYQNYKHSIYQSAKVLDALKQDGLAQVVGIYSDTSIPIHKQFFAPTRKGARSIDLEDEYKYVGLKSGDSVQHESSSRDIAIAFLDLFPRPDWNVRVEFNKDICGVNTDIIVRVDHYLTNNFFSFVLETEIKSDAQAVSRTVNKYIKVFNEIDFNEYNLSPKTKLLTVINNGNFFRPFKRPTQYSQLDVKKGIAMVDNLFKNVLKYGQDLDKNRYRFMPFYDFYQLNQPVWSMPNGQKVSLIMTEN
ncbi:hypothetical protein H8D83_01980 [Candidatus Woesearchaeota archaeon]|nr:hypothetical protein [Candidatus Woesearchaeota archaeon]